MKSKRVLLFICTVLFSSVFADKHCDHKEPKEDIYKGFKLFSDVAALLEDRAFRNVDFLDFFKTSLKAGLSTIDAHSSFITNYEKVTDDISGNFSGIGISVIAKSKDDDSLIVVDVLEGTPSNKAGILAGDKIIAVDEQKIKGLTSDEVIDKMKGKRGTKVKLKIIRNKRAIDFEVLRDIITDQSSFAYHFTEQNVYYLGLKLFSENSPEQMKALLERVNQDDSCKGLILDLRNNAGGILESGVDMASLFLPKSSLIVTTRDNNNNIVGSYSTSKMPILKKDICVFVLVNNFTASASEILAGALRYHSDRIYSKEKEGEGCQARPMIFLVGTTTFGKGSVQEVIPLSGGCALKLTSMLYFLPDAKSVQAKGVSPDFLIHSKAPVSRELKWIYELYGQEKSMKHHITDQEVYDVLNKKQMKLATEIDKEEIKRLQKLESRRDKEESTEREIEDDFLYKDVGSAETTGSDNSSNEEDKKVDYEAKRKQSLARDYQVQCCINMTTMFDMAKKCFPEKVSNRQKALSFLKSNFITDEGLNISKLD